VNNPDQVAVTETATERTAVIELRVAPDDLGRVIGKEGRTAKAIRTILNAASTRENRRVVLEIME
jgi:predicted RNA-binding protein YlqC (UPF0109 family)